MGTSRKSDDHAALNARRMVRWMWLLGFLPLVGVLAAGLQTSRTETWVQTVGTVTVPRGIVHIQSGHDRRGEHVAVLGYDRSVLVIELRGGQVVTQVLPSPWADNDGYRVRLSIADATQDDLVDLVLSRYKVEGEMSTEGRSRDLPWECAIFRQERDQFVLDRLEDRTPFTSTARESMQLFAYGQQLRLATATVDSGPLTQVCEADSRRVVELLAGEPYAVRDLDGDGNQDLLTSQETGSGTESMTSTFRLYLFRDDGVHAVWSADFEQLDLWRMPRRYTELADLDGDGLVELIVCEPHRGLVSVFSIDPEKLTG